MTNRLTISKATAAAAQFLTNPVSSYKFRKDIQGETLERVLNDAIREGRGFKGIVLSVTQQTDNLTDSEGGLIQHLSSNIRILGLHDKILPDPLDCRCNADLDIDQLIAVHPVMQSKERISGQGIRIGSIVDVEFIDGIPFWSETEAIDNRYLGLLSQQPQQATGSQDSFNSGSPSLAGDKNGVTWRLSRKLGNTQTSTRAKEFLDKFTQLLSAYPEFNGFQVVVSSLKRTPRQQALAMIKQVDDAKKDGEIWWPYGKSTRRRRTLYTIAYSKESKEQRVKKMIPLIEHSIGTSDIISKHLVDGAMDIRTKDIKNPKVAKKLSIFKQAAIDTKIAQSVELEKYEDSPKRKKKRDAGGSPASGEHLHLSLIGKKTGE